MAYIRSIEFPVRLAGIRLGAANCYLMRASMGYVLVDTEFDSNRADLIASVGEVYCARFLGT